MRVRRHILSLLAFCITLAIAVGGQSLVSATASADRGNYVKSLRCDVADPRPFMGPIHVTVDIYRDLRFPPDGAQPPVLYFRSNTTNRNSFPHLIYDVNTTIYWRNLTNGRRGAVTIPAQGFKPMWEGSISTGHGTVKFLIRERVGARLGFPNMFQQVRDCSGSAIA